METTTLTPEVQTAPPAPVATDRDVQRATLRDLVALATECAATESEIERRYRAQVEDEDKTFKRVTFDTRNKYSNQREGVRRTRETAIAAVDGQFQTAFDELKADDEEARRKLASRHDLTIQEVKSKFNQAVWLADSVLENAQNGVALDYKKAKDLVEAHIKALDDTDAHAKRLLKSDKSKIVDPPEDQAPAATDPQPEQAQAAYDALRTKAEQHLAKLGSLILPRLFVGITPVLLVGVMCVLAGVGVQVALQTSTPNWAYIGAAAGGALVLCLVLGFLLKGVARGRVRDQYLPLHQAVIAGRRAAAAELIVAQQSGDARIEKAAQQRKAEAHGAKEKYAPYMTEGARKRDAALKIIQTEYAGRMAKVEAERDRGRAAAQEAERVQLADVQQREERETQRLTERHDLLLKQSKKTYDDARAALAGRLHTGLQRIQVPVVGGDGRLPVDWNDPAWRDFKTPTQFPGVVRFGELRVDLRSIADGLPQTAAEAGKRDEGSRAAGSSNGSGNGAGAGAGAPFP